MDQEERAVVERLAKIPSDMMIQHQDLLRRIWRKRQLVRYFTNVALRWRRRADIIRKTFNLEAKDF